MRAFIPLPPSCLLFLALLVFIVVALSTGILRTSDDAKEFIAEKVQCVLYLVDGIPDPDLLDFGVETDDEEWVCIDRRTRTEYSLDGLPPDFFEQNDVLSGFTILTITSNVTGHIIVTDVDHGNGKDKGTAAQPTAAPTHLTSSAPTYFNASLETEMETYPSSEDDDIVISKPILNATGNNVSVSLDDSDDDDDDDDDDENNGRWQTKLSGQVSLLIVRVTDGEGNEPRLSAEEISDVVFGTYGDPVNLRSQYLACSGGQLDFTPALGEGLIDGVLDIVINQKVEGVDRADVARYVNAAVPKYLDGHDEQDLFDYTIYVLPAAVNFRGAGAFAAVGGRRAVFRDTRINILLIQMHEVGHLLGMRHSGYGNSEYGDTTCFEGAHLYARNAPEMCFNAAKSWYLGWYNNPSSKQGHDVISPMSESWHGNLVGKDDYVNSRYFSDEKHRVILKVETTSQDINEFPDLYIMFNLKQGFNAGVQGFENKVNIISQAREWGTQSWLIGSLDGNGGTNIFRQANFDDSGKDLVVQVCELVVDDPQPAYASLLVYLDDDDHRLDCGILV